MRASLLLTFLSIGFTFSAYVDVDQSVFEHFGGGKQSISNAGSQFVDVTRANADGKRKVKFVQYHDGIRVLNTGVVATENEAGLAEVTGKMLNIDAVDQQNIINSLSMIDPLEAAKEFYRKQLGVSELDIEEGTTKVEMVIDDDGHNHARKVFEVVFFVQSPMPHRPFFHIDPTSGDVLDWWEGLEGGWTPAKGTGPGGNEKTKKVHIRRKNWGFVSIV